MRAVLLCLVVCPPSAPRRRLLHPCPSLPGNTPRRARAFTVAPALGFRGGGAVW